MPSVPARSLSSLSVTLFKGYETLSAYLVRHLTVQLIVIILCVIVGWRLFFYSRHPFWDIQPVFHYRHLRYWFYDHGILRKELPPRNRFVNPLNIQTYTYLPSSSTTSTATSTSTTATSSVSTASVSALSPILKNECTALLSTEYHRSPDTQYAPTDRDIWCYFEGHSAPCFVSVYSRIEPAINRDTHDIHSLTSVQGVITSRPMHVAIRRNNTYSHMTVYYVDFLCVSKNQRKKNIAPQLIQTHEYNQSHAYLPISVSVFKREEELTSIVPIVLYSVVGYSIAQWKQSVWNGMSATTVAPATSTTHPVCNGKGHIVTVSRTNFAIYLSALASMSNQPAVRFFLSAHTANHLECIENNQWHVFMLVDHEHEIDTPDVPHGVVALYYFRNTRIEWNRQPVVSLFASIRRTSTAPRTDPSIFLEGGFACLSILDHLASAAPTAPTDTSPATTPSPPTSSMKNIQNAPKPPHPLPHYTLLCIENLGENSAFLLPSSAPARPLYQSKMAFYFYNFAHRTFQPSQCLILA
jgi:hypothetical protein